MPEEVRGKDHEIGQAKFNQAFNAPNLSFTTKIVSDDAIDDVLDVSGQITPDVRKSVSETSFFSFADDIITDDSLDCQRLHRWFP